MTTIILTNLLRRPARTAFTAAGIALGVATIVALLSFTAGLRETATGLVHLGGSDLGVFQGNVSDPTASILPEAIVRRLAARPDIARATPLLLTVEAVKGDPSAILFGAEPGGFFTQSLVIVDGHEPLTASSEIMVGDRLAAQRHLRPGATLTAKGHRFKIAGVYHSGILFEDSGAVMAIEQARKLAGLLSNEETDVVVQLSYGTSARTAARAIEHSMPGTQVISDPEQALRAGANSTLISKAILVIVVIALIIGAISVTNTMAMSVAERHNELGLLSTVGWSSPRVALMILGEGVAVSVLGGALGLLIGVIGADLLVRALGVSTYIQPSVTAWGLGRGLLVGVAIGVLGGVYPAWRVTRMTPLKALAGT
jgi:putative ABC transport system permease protein